LPALLMFDATADHAPIPRQVSISGPPAYVLVSGIRDSKNMPPAANSGPTVISGRAPTLATS